jgi:tetratricopeptide (TPR) repeat protein
MTIRKISSRPTRRRTASRWSSTGGTILLVLLSIIFLSGHALAADDSDQQVPPVTLDGRLTKQAVQYAEGLLHKMDSTNPKLISKINAGDTESLYYVAKHMVEHGSDSRDPPAVALSILHTLADGKSQQSRSRSRSPPHVKSQVVLAVAYYNKGDKEKAIHYFELAGEQGPHQAALYDAGRTHAELENWVPAIAYIRESAVFGDIHPEVAVNEALTKTVVQAYDTFSQKIAGAHLSIEQTADIYMYGALKNTLSKDDDNKWKVAVTNLATFNETVTGIEADYTALFAAYRNLRQLWKASSGKMSPLQAHFLLKLINDAFGYLTTIDNELLLLAAEYAEDLALSTYCYEQVATLTKSTGGDCFNVAVARAVSYYRRAKDSEGAKRMRQLAERHGTAATDWTGPLDQNPAVYHPELVSSPFWETKEFATVRDLQKMYERSKSIRKELQVVQALSEKSDRQEIETNERGELIQTRRNDHVGFRNVVSPYTRAQKMRNPTSGEIHLGGYAEFGPLFDGKLWDEARCRLVPTLCQAFQSNPVSLCSTEKASKKSRYCWSDEVVTMVRLKPGTTILPGSGHTNAQLTMHLNLQGCQGVELTVGGAIAKNTGKDGHAIVFDDSFEHSIYHGGTQDCYLVKAVLAHPDLSF